MPDPELSEVQGASASATVVHPDRPLSPEERAHLGLPADEEQTR